ncbi:MAG: sigma-70 family RNA polymerase sigma factor [Myxococcales bacterium]|nr:sigma-70 family RNA polymerase sigma factor [Myxococcales bacterium]
MGSIAEGAEAAIHEACGRGDYDGATRLGLEVYGHEVLAFLHARLRQASDADDVFATFAEKLWHGLPGFRWECSLRSFCYRIARNATNDFLGAAHRRRERNLTLSRHAALSAMIDGVRSETAAYRKSAVKDRMQELRESLPDDDQMLLILRVDREMSWNELASAMADGEGGCDEAFIRRESARLRKRFERVKERLRELARADGLI